MKAFAAVLLSLCPLAARADEKYLGSINSTAGASSNNFAAGSTKADGTAGAFTLSGSVRKPQALLLQCDVAVRYRTGTGSGVAAANSGANKGLRLDASQVRALRLTGDAIAIIPAAGSGAAVCDVWLNTTP